MWGHHPIEPKVYLALRHSRTACMFNISRFLITFGVFIQTYSVPSREVIRGRERDYDSVDWRKRLLNPRLSTRRWLSFNSAVNVQASSTQGSFQRTIRTELPA